MGRLETEFGGGIDEVGDKLYKKERERRASTLMSHF